VLARARYTEDRLAMAVERGVAQYVLVGAGLDTFVFRRADMRDRVEVFELDHPQSQALKRERLATAGLADPSNLHFGIVDFERESVADALARLPFDRTSPRSSPGSG
jgi:methyltransferase (TIGR00027 family)